MSSIFEPAAKDFRPVIYDDVTDMNPDHLQKMYLDYINNFCMRQRFADYYGISLAKASAIIAHGSKIHKRRTEFTKEDEKLLEKLGVGG